MKQYYRIGDITIEYDGLPFKERDEMAAFRDGMVKDAEIRCSLTAVAAIAPIMFPMGGSKGQWKSDLEFICRTADRREMYLTDQQKNVELQIVESKGLFFRRHEAQILEDYAGDVGMATVLRVIDLPFEVLHFGGVFLHASFIEWHGKAVLFTAPKQTGKSTQAALWAKYNQAQIINGDRALLRKQNGVWHAFGSPYCGTSHISKNKALPITAIVILGQAPENRLKKANTQQALQAMLEGCSYDTWDRIQVLQVMDMAEDMIKSIPFWKLDCLPDESAVRLLEQVL